MIKINDTFSIERDSYNWILHQKVKGWSEKRGEFETTRKSYHSTLEQCLRHVRDIECGQCDTIEALFSALQRSYKLERISVDKYLETVPV